MENKDEIIEGLQDKLDESKIDNQILREENQKLQDRLAKLEGPRELEFPIVVYEKPYNNNNDELQPQIRNLQPIYLINTEIWNLANLMRMR